MAFQGRGSIEHHVPQQGGIFYNWYFLELSVYDDYKDKANWLQLVLLLLLYLYRTGSLLFSAPGLKQYRSELAKLLVHKAGLS